MPTGRPLEREVARRKRSRRNIQFHGADWARVAELLGRHWSPEQSRADLRRAGELRISHDAIYRHTWPEHRPQGGTLHRELRGARTNCRKHYRHPDRRRRLTTQGVGSDADWENAGRTLPAMRLDGSRLKGGTAPAGPSPDSHEWCGRRHFRQFPKDDHERPS